MGCTTPCTCMKGHQAPSPNEGEKIIRDTVETLVTPTRIHMPPSFEIEWGYVVFIRLFCSMFSPLMAVWSYTFLLLQNLRFDQDALIPIMVDVGGILISGKQCESERKGIIRIKEGFEKRRGYLEDCFGIKFEGIGNNLSGADEKKWREYKAMAMGDFSYNIVIPDAYEYSASSREKFVKVAG